MSEKLIEGIKEKELEEEFPFTYSITSYGADYTVDGLVKRIRDGNIYIPIFQRGYVWNIREASRFIESLLLGLPVPGIFLSRDEETKRLLVIDGQQRLKTLRYFYDGIFHNTGKEFALKNIKSRYINSTYKSLSDIDRIRLDDSIIHATIVKQDEPANDFSSIFLIFERLNTGGELLRAQEIRSAIYSGEFNNLIKLLNENPSWRKIYGRVSPRMRDQELILRFFALYFFRQEYKKPMKEFLNQYMSKNRDLKVHSSEQLTKLFTSTIKVIDETFGKTAFRLNNSFVAAICDAIMVGVALRLKKGIVIEPQTLATKYKEILHNKEFVEAVSVHTTDDENIKKRLDLAKVTFDDIP